MASRSSLDFGGDWELLLVLALSTGILFVGGLISTYQSVLQAVLSHTLTLSPIEWAIYTVGAFLVEPVLLFAALYYVGSRSEITTSPSTLLAGLGVAVVVGTLLGQFIGVRVWMGAMSSTSDVPLTRAWVGLFVPDPRALGYWRILVEPLVHDYLTAIAAFGLSDMMD